MSGSITVPGIFFAIIVICVSFNLLWSFLRLISASRPDLFLHCFLFLSVFKSPIMQSRFSKKYIGKPDSLLYDWEILT